MANKVRLIDANEAMKKQIYGNTRPILYRQYAMEVLQNAPTVDPVHAAGACYCRECVHWKKCYSSLIGDVMCCTGQGSMYIQKGAGDFCSSGERRDSNAND